MNEDRLELLKKKIKLPVTWGKFTEADRDWLISEVERLRGLNHAQHHEYERLEATIASLKAKLNFYENELVALGPTKPFLDHKAGEVVVPTEGVGKLFNQLAALREAASLCHPEHMPGCIDCKRLREAVALTQKEDGE